MNVEVINAKTISEAWIESVRRLVRLGFYEDIMHIIAKGSYEEQRRIEFPYLVINIEYPEVRPLIPIMPDGLNIPVPFDEQYLEEYSNYIITGYKPSNTEYTYGERLVVQYSEVIRIYKELKEKGNMYTNQCCMEIGKDIDLYSSDPPCCRLVQTNVKDNKLNFFMFFRSWDLWGGMPLNIAGFQLLKEYMADEIGIEPGATIVSSSGAHIYDHCWEVAKLLSRKDPDKYKFVGEE